MLNLRELFTAGIEVHKLFLFYLFARGSMGFRATMYGSQKSHYPCLNVTRMKKKMKNYYVLKNYHRIKTTQPISMILVSFFSEDNVLFDEIKICFIFEYQGNKIRAFRFLGTLGILFFICYPAWVPDITRIRAYKKVIFIVPRSFL